MKTKLATLVLALALTFSSLAEARDVLRRANPSEPDSLDPQKASLVPDQVVIGDLFEGLVTTDSAGAIIPGAASHWEVSEDGLTYRFHLREGLIWSDGAPLSAFDYEAGYRRLYDPKTAARPATFVYMIKNAEAVNKGEMALEDLGVHALDELTLEVQLEHPSPLFIRTAAAVWFYPVPRHRLTTSDEPWYRPETFVGNGPFVLEEWSPNDKIVLTKSKTYRDAASVKLQSVVYYPAEDADASLRRFRAGEIDFVAGMPSNKIKFLQEHLAEETRIGPRPANNYVVFNMESPPFDDIRVRKALSLAIDRETYTSKVLGKGERPAYTFVPDVVEDYDAKPLPFITVPMEERRAEARALLAEAGFTKDNPLSFEFRVRGSPDRRRGAVVLQSMWKDVGVQADILSTDLKVHYADLYLGKFQVADAGFVSTTGPDLLLEEFSSANDVGNFSNYKNPAYDKLLDAGLHTADLKERHRLMAAAEEIMLNDYPVAPVNFSVTGNLVSTKLRGYVDNIYDAHASAYLWIEEDSP